MSKSMDRRYTAARNNQIARNEALMTMKYSDQWYDTFEEIADSITEKSVALVGEEPDYYETFYLVGLEFLTEGIKNLEATVRCFAAGGLAQESTSKLANNANDELSEILESLAVLRAEVDKKIF